MSTDTKVSDVLTLGSRELPLLRTALFIASLSLRALVAENFDLRISSVNGLRSFAVFIVRVDLDMQREAFHTFLIAEIR